MSTPINHHYVSQCHQKEFFNIEEKYIYLYDKELNRFYQKRSTKRIFSQDYSNTKEINGKLDNITLENELKILFEDDFTNHIAKIMEIVKDQNEILLQTNDSLDRITILGIIGELRHPKFKTSIDEAMLEFESNILSSNYNIGKKDVKEFLKKEQTTRESNSINYIPIANRILSKMKPLDFEIYYINSNDHFLLPDTSCFQCRGQLNNYLNSDIREIIQVGIPLSDKLFLLSTPKILKTQHHGIKIIDENESKTVYGINICLYEFAKKSVACKDENYLKKTIGKFKNRRV